MFFHRIFTVCLVVGRKQVTYIGIRTKGKKVMPVHAVGVLPEKIFLFYIGSIADNNQKMKGKKEYERKNGRGKEVQTNCRL